MIHCDASLKACGTVCKGVKAGSIRTADERMKHINELELLAAFLALKSFAKELCNYDVGVFVDNNTAVACLNRIGSSSPLLLTA